MVVDTDAEVAKVGVQSLSAGVGDEAEVVGHVGRNEVVFGGTSATDIGLNTVVVENNTSEINVAVSRPFVTELVVHTRNDAQLHE